MAAVAEVVAHDYSLPGPVFSVKLCLNINVPQNFLVVRRLISAGVGATSPENEHNDQRESEHCAYDNDDPDDVHTLIVHVEKPRCQPEEDLG